MSSSSLKIADFDYSINPDDLFLIFDSLLKQKGLNSHHIESANHFYRNGISQIIKQGFKIYKELANKRNATDEDREIERIYCEVIPTEIRLRPPTTLTYRTGKETILYPKVALQREKVYSGPLLISCDVIAKAYLKDGSVIERKDSVKDFRISKVPIIKGSIMCNTYGKSKEALMQMGEDPSDPGGYFIVKGEWAVDCTENITFNQPKIYRNEGYGKSLVRCEYISKPGDNYQNSDYLIIKYSKDSTLTIEIMRDKLNNVPIPFYLVFRALGWTSDREMMEWIIFDFESPANKSLLNILIESTDAKYGKPDFRNMYKQQEALKAIVDLIPKELYGYLDLEKKPENYHNAIEDVLRIFDTYCLPHIGMNESARHDKLKFLGLLIRKTILVHLQYIPETNRDSYRNKRIHSAGDNYAKTFKTFFNQTVVLPIKRRIARDFNNASFSQVNLANLVKSAIYADDFERLIVQTIVSGNKSNLTIRKRNVVNRLATQQLNRKNQLNMLATMRQVTATSADSAKQSERASEMRQVAMSALGYICVNHSPPEGEKVGINKQMAMFATIAPASSSEVLRKTISSDPDVIAESRLTPLQIYRGNFARVYVNGYLMGYTMDSLALVAKYRKKRRAMIINPHTTIYWDNTQNEVQFFVDNGRITRPLMIVYNNRRDAEHFTGDQTKQPYKQGTAVTQADIISLYKGTKTIDDLLKEQKIEFITPEEQEICYVCPNFDTLKANQSDECIEYTHLDIPQSLLGITALTAPFGNHNQAPRVTYQTSQAKQTCGYYSLNWPFRMDKETFLQYTNETPLVRTAVNKYVFPNGNNVMVAIMCYTGFNQEDSLIVNRAAIERGLFDGCKFTFYKTELEQKEELGNPDASKTENLKSANYDKLANGIVQKGQHIGADDVLIGKYMPIAKGKDERNVYTDTSIVYKEDEPAIVHNAIVDRNEDDARFAKVALRKIRPVAVGDKFCVFPQAEVLTEQGWKKISDLRDCNINVATMDPATFELSYVRPTAYHEFDYDSKVDGKMYSLKTQQVHTVVTPNHKNYIKLTKNKSYKLVEAKNQINTNKWFKKDCINNMEEYTEIELDDENGNSHRYNANAYLKLLGMFLSDGYVTNNTLGIAMSKERKRNYIRALEETLGFNFRYTNRKQILVGKTASAGIFEEFKTLSVGAHNKYIPDYIWDMGRENCRALLDGLINGDGHIEIRKTNYGRIRYVTTSSKLADDIQRLCLHAGYTANIKLRPCVGKQSIIRGRVVTSNYDCYAIAIMKDKGEPEIRKCMFELSNQNKEELIDYKGKVCCIEVPDTHIFYYRENQLSPAIWTGNSSRSGQKGIASLLMNEADMPMTLDGMRPSLLFNPHGMPSRMTVAQQIESLLANVCAIKGTHHDGTMFKPADIESIAEELEQYGFNRYGYERMISGITGEFIDTEVFFGPTFYQRLQKFVADAEYSVRHALTDAITYQPLDIKGFVYVWMQIQASSFVTSNTFKLRETPSSKSKFEKVKFQYTLTIC